MKTPKNLLSMAVIVDGTAVFDGGKQDDPGNTFKQGNSFKHYQAKTITENLHARISNLDPQEIAFRRGGGRNSAKFHY